MVGSPRHANEVSGLDLDGEHGSLRRVNVEQAAAFDDEADFVLVVPVLGVELLSIASRFGCRGVTSMTSAVT